MESQTRSPKRAFRELQDWRVQVNLQPFANPSPTLCQPFAANPLPTFAANPSPSPFFAWTPGTRFETRFNGFLDKVGHDSNSLRVVNFAMRGRHVCRTKLHPKSYRTYYDKERSKREKGHESDPKRLRCFCLPLSCCLKIYDVTGTFLKLRHRPKPAQK